MNRKAFNELKKGDKLSYCLDGTYTVTSVHQTDGETTKLHARNTAGETIDLTFDDASEMARVS